MSIPPASAPGVPPAATSPTGGAVDGPGAPGDAALQCAPRRFVACTLDTLIVLVPLWLLATATGGVTGNGATFTFTPGWAGIVFAWVVGITYFCICEYRWGATPGKRLCGLRAVGADGAALTPRAAVVRNVARLVDQFLCPVVGPVAMLSDTQRRRIGDAAARTRVVRVARRQDADGPFSAGAPVVAAGAVPPTGPAPQPPWPTAPRAPGTPGTSGTSGGWP